MNLSNDENAQLSAWQRQVAELQDQARQAFLAQDIEGMSLILSDDFIVNSPIGRILTKGETLDLLQRGVIRHFAYDEQVELMTRHGALVIVMGQDVVTNASDGPPLRRRFTNVWYEAVGSWQLLARHANHIADS
jgi:hypothetical protein